MNSLRAAGLVVGFGLLTTPALAGGHFQVLHTFTAGSAKGWLPSGALAVGERGEIYGTTQRGGRTCPTGQFSCGGTVYRLNPPALSGSRRWTYEPLVNFPGGPAGSYPVSGLTREQGTGILYGTTEYGGDTTCAFEPHHWGCGTVFQLKPPTAANPKWQRVVLHRFSAEQEGRLPTTPPILVGGGALVGTTANGGVDNNGGAYRIQFVAPTTLTPTVDNAGFRLEPAASHWKFNGDYWEAASSTDGKWPEGVVTCGDNAQPADFDTGGECVCPDGSPESDFDCSAPEPCEGESCGVSDCDYDCDDGGFRAPRTASVARVARPAATSPSRVLYGVTASSGSDACVGSGNQGCGVVFTLTPNRRGDLVEQVLYSFLGGTDGFEPIGKLTRGQGGVLYGTTLWGGTSCPVKADKGCGTVFRLTPPKRRGDAWTETILHRFTGGKDGALPAGSIVLGTDGAVYGATTYGGGCTSDTRGCGTIFKLIPPLRPAGPWREVILHAFQNQRDGANPSGALVRTANDHIYGTAGNVLFQITP